MGKQKKGRPEGTIIRLKAFFLYYSEYSDYTEGEPIFRTANFRI
jgi:hypothetical protein